MAAKDRIVHGDTTITVTYEDLAKALMIPTAAFIEKITGKMTVGELLDHKETTLQCLKEELFEGLVDDFDDMTKDPPETKLELAKAMEDTVS